MGNRFARFLLLFSAHANSLRLRSAAAHFVRRAVALASARSVPRTGIHQHGCSGSENGLSEAKKAVRP
ncbi:MAG: hypothetical protein ACR2OL_12465, partial [Anderseniella sp.]